MTKRPRQEEPEPMSIQEELDELRGIVVRPETERMYKAIFNQIRVWSIVQGSPVITRDTLV